MIASVEWVVLAALAVVAVLTWWQPGHHPWLVGLTSVAPVLGLLAWPGAVVAAARTDWPALAVSGVLIGSHAAFVLPTMHPWRTAAAVEGSWRLRVYTHNILMTNVGLPGFAEQIARLAPDVVVLEELSPGNLATIETSGALAAYPSRCLRPADDGYGFGIWSAIAMTERPLSDPQRQTEMAAILTPDGQPPITLLAIHTTAPVLPLKARRWAAELATLRNDVRKVDGTLIAVGDLNATTTMRRCRAVLPGALVDAATSLGRGWRMTWPGHLWVTRPIIRIDHVWHSPDLTATGYVVGDRTGSDHRPLLVTLGRVDAARNRADRISHGRKAG